MDKELWYFLIEGKQNSKTGVFGNFYAYGDHLGDAQERAIYASSKRGIYDQNTIEVSFLNSIDIVDNKDELIKITNDVFMRPTLYTFALNKPDKDFTPPIGIIKSNEEGEYDYGLIKECFAAYNADKKGFFELELVLEKHSLIKTFFKTIELLPSISGFYVYIKNHWNNESTEIWEAKQLKDKESVINFLNSEQKNTLQNGYIDIAIHSTTGETNLILNDHKLISLRTKDEQVFRDFIGKIIGFGYKQTRDFYNLQYGYHHFHYRPAGSLTRNEFKQLLIMHKFYLINQ